MPYARRNSEGQIESLHRTAGDDASEELDDRHPDVLAFLGRDADASFSQLDADLVRVIEDVIDVLVAKHILNITDLPSEAQAKLFARKGFRDRVSAHSLQLFGTGSSDVI